jgi:hypothetical protein
VDSNTVSAASFFTNVPPPCSKVASARSREPELAERWNRSLVIQLIWFENESWLSTGRDHNRMLYGWKTDIMDPKESDAPIAFREELIQAIEIWNATPVSILDRQAVHMHALLLAMGNTSPIAKKEGS